MVSMKELTGYKQAIRNIAKNNGMLQLKVWVKRNILAWYLKAKQVGVR